MTLIKQSEKYIHQETGITVKVYYDFSHISADIKWNATDHVLEIPNNLKKKVRLQSNHNDGLFVFSNSTPAMVKIVGNALCEISEFVEKL